MVKKLTKKELIAVLIEEYGYEQEDIKMLTNAKLEAMIKQEESDKEAFEIQDTYMEVAKDSGFKDDDLIVVMNGVSGALVHHSYSTGRFWEFREFGVTHKIPYGELVNIRNNNPKVFEKGWMIVLNPKIQEDFGLKEIYKNILTPNNIEKVFEKDTEELNVFIDNLPEGMKTTFIAKARELYRDDKILNLKTVRFIQEKFGISLDDNAPLSDIV